MELYELKLLINKIEGLCADQESVVLYSLARQIDTKGVILELGSFKGRQTICFAKALEEKKEGKVYTIDANLFRTKDALLRNIKQFGVRELVVPIFKHSAWANIGWQKPIKLIWIDTDARYFSVKCDFLLWEPYLAIGGVIALNCASSLDIKRLVDEYIIGSHRFRNLTTVGSIVFAYKNKETPAYAKWKIIYIRSIYSLYYIFKKILYHFLYKMFPHLSAREFSLKKATRSFFERLLKI